MKKQTNTQLLKERCRKYKYEASSILYCLISIALGSNQSVQQTFFPKIAVVFKPETVRSWIKEWECKVIKHIERQCLKSK